jgi:UDP-glucose 4-epimerase
VICMDGKTFDKLKAEYAGRKVLVTGGLGFIGSNLVHDLVRMGAQVTVLDCKLEGSGANEDNLGTAKEKVRLIVGDIRDPHDVKEAVRDNGIIFNCAAQESHVTSMKDPFLDIDINLKGHLNILDECRKHNDAAKVVYTGSRGQLGKLDRLPADESQREMPTDVMGVDKLAAEHYHLIYFDTYGIKTTSLRLVNTYGPRDKTDNPSHNVVNFMIGKALRGETITVFEPGTQKRDCTYVDDVNEALLLCGASGRADGKVYNLGTASAIPFVEIAKMIVSIAGTGKWEFVPWPAERKKIEVGDSILSFGRINNDLGWAPTTGLEEGIAKTIKFYRGK